jgi:hypothetical protein
MTDKTGRTRRGEEPSDQNERTERAKKRKPRLGTNDLLPGCPPRGPFLAGGLAAGADGANGERGAGGADGAGGRVRQQPPPHWHAPPDWQPQPQPEPQPQAPRTGRCGRPAGVGRGASAPAGAVGRETGDAEDSAMVSPPRTPVLRYFGSRKLRDAGPRQRAAAELGAAQLVLHWTSASGRSSTARDRRITGARAQCTRSAHAERVRAPRRTPRTPRISGTCGAQGVQET